MINQSINPPDLDDLLAENRDVLLSNINCVQIGKIQKINDDQTAEIEIQFLRRLQDGKTARYPLLVDCPYFVLSGGDSYIDMPIKKGDCCIILFNDRNIDDWWDTANVTVPSDTRKHSIADGIALVGINPRISALTFDGINTRIVGPGGSAIMSLSPDGKITVVTEGETGDLIVDNISLKYHVHLDSWGLPTSEPKPIGFVPPAAPATIILQSDINTNSKKFDGVIYDQHGHPYTWTDSAGSSVTGGPQ